MVYNWNAAKSYQANDYSITGMVSLKRRYIIPYSLFCSELKTALKKSEIFFFFLKDPFKVLWKCMTWGPDLTGMLSKAIPENVTFKLRPE